ncbi:MAG: family 10 glycosylhydrolase [Eubacterium sp.]|nr:family 10 glycosylhydrolase [Eubacterium sp.]
MYKKIIFPLAILLMLSLCSCTNQEIGSDKADNKFIKSVWITYYELSEFTKGRDEETFSKTINSAFETLSKKGFNRVTVQVRPFADAFYKSSYFPTSAYFSGVQGSEMTYDPLDIIVSIAHKHNLSIEAWINPYRVSSNTDFDELADSNIALSWKDTDNVIVCDGGIYFNPASNEVNELILNGIKEITQNYEVDSICFDDYFYPSSSKKIDSNSYKNYTKNGGEMNLDDWRRDNVNRMVKSVYKAVKSVNENVTFGISPAANIENDYSSLYADVELWSKEKGYVDYICPQIYFGFQNENQPFMKTAKTWAQMADCDLYVALPLYKQGAEDEFAGDQGFNEFVNNNNIISRQFTYLTKLDNVSGIYVFSYSSLGDNDETNNLYSAMQKSSV